MHACSLLADLSTWGARSIKSADALIDFFGRLNSWLRRFTEAHTVSQKRELAAPPLAASMAAEVGSRASVTTLRTHLRQMRAGLVELGVESSAVKSSTINDSDNMLMRIEFLLLDTGIHYTAFFTAPDKPAASGGSGTGTAATGSDSGGGGGRGGRGRGRGGRRGGARGAGCFHCGEKGHRAKDCPNRRAAVPSSRSTDGVLHILCWSASVAFRPVAKRAASVLLTSGTLQPMDLLTSEFFAPDTQPPPPPPKPGVANEKQVEVKEEPPERLSFLQFSAPHFDAVANNLLNLFVSEAPSRADGGGVSVPLRGDFASRSDADYLSALGGCVLRTARVVPKGLLVYFPSTAVMQACLSNWGIITQPLRAPPPGSVAQQLQVAKSIFVEPMRATADEFDSVLSNYKRAAEVGSGAVLFGVLRGRASEGLNFSHDHARGVVMIGIAYPPIYDIKVQSKRNRPLGQQWYTGQAFKAANQAIGRLIRNTQDYGVLVLLDRRYAGETLRQMLPGWVLGARRQWHARAAGELEPGLAAVAAFFAAKEAERKQCM